MPTAYSETVKHVTTVHSYTANIIIGINELSYSKLILFMKILLLIFRQTLEHNDIDTIIVALC